MKAEIWQDGRLVLIPESVTEETAIALWQKSASVEMDSLLLNEKYFYRGSSVCAAWGVVESTQSA